MTDTTLRLYALLLYVVLSGIAGVIRGCGCEHCRVTIRGRSISLNRACGFLTGVLWALALLSVVTIIVGF
jgi:hypothetical protein